MKLTSNGSQGVEVFSERERDSEVMCNLFIMEHYPLNEMKCVDISKTTFSLRRAKSVIFASNLIPLDFAPP